MHETAPVIAVLFARADSVYKTLPGCDVWDESRDARNWAGGSPLVAHPPCRLWAKLRQFAKASDPVSERQLAIDAVRNVQRFGGVLEHPVGSHLWPVAGLPMPGDFPDAHGGWALRIEQRDFGHRAEKATLLYIVGCQWEDLPPMPPPAQGRATHVINHCLRGPDGRLIRKGHPDWRPECSKPEREHTPPQLAKWLVELARRCTPQTLTMDQS